MLDFGVKWLIKFLNKILCILHFYLHCLPKCREVNA